MVLSVMIALTAIAGGLSALMDRATGCRQFALGGYDLDFSAAILNSVTGIPPLEAQMARSRGAARVSGADQPLFPLPRKA
jgi:hypothetical protein